MNPHHTQRRVAVCSSSAVCNRIRPTPFLTTPSQNLSHDACVHKASARSAVPCDKGIVLSNRNITSGIIFLRVARPTTVVALCVTARPVTQERFPTQNIHTYAVNSCHEYLDAILSVIPFTTKHAGQPHAKFVLNLCILCNKQY